MVLAEAPSEAQPPRGGPVSAWPQRLPPLALWWGLALVVAVITALAWPTIPSYDPFSWVVWGREVSDPHIGFFVGGGPSWKPLPFLFTAVFGAFGSAAPALWVIVARTGGVAGLVAAGRLARLLCLRAGLPRWTTWLAAMIAAVALVLTIDWSYYFFRGASEPLLIACALWSVDRGLAGRHRQAYFLLACEGLMRPEAWPFLFLYGVWLFVRGDRSPWTRALVVLGLAAQPIGWFVPPWISTGQPFLAATHASEYNGHLGANPFATVLGRGEALQPLPALVLAFVAVALGLWFSRRALRAAWRGGDWGQRLRALPVEAWTAVLIVGWWVVVVGMTLDGYPGLQRFFLPAAALTCVLGAVGLVRLAALVPGPAVLGAVVAALLLVGSYHYVAPRVRFVRAQEPLAARAVHRIDELGLAVRQLGGRQALLPCPSSVVTINHSLQTALAFKLGTTLERVQTVLRTPGIAFVGPHDSIDGGVPPIAFKFTARLLRHVGAWKIYVVDRAGQSTPRCVGR